jgi:hypothetical protein
MPRPTFLGGRFFSPTMADAGRPPTITDEKTLKKLLEAFEWGMNQKDAAKYAGIAPPILIGRESARTIPKIAHKHDGFGDWVAQ